MRAVAEVKCVIFGQNFIARRADGPAASTAFPREADACLHSPPPDFLFVK